MKIKTHSNPTLVVDIEERARVGRLILYLIKEITQGGGSALFQLLKKLHFRPPLVHWESVWTELRFMLGLVKFKKMQPCFNSYLPQDCKCFHLLCKDDHKSSCKTQLCLCMKHVNCGSCVNRWRTHQYL